MGYRGPRGAVRRPSPHTLLLVVAVVYGCLVLSRLPSLPSLTWDEIVYASQFRPGVPAVAMSAPRAWGMPLLLSPVVAVTGSVAAIRAYLSVLAAVGLYAAFRPWLPLGYAAPLAAGLLCSLWSTVLFGALGYPNLWLAFALVAGVGWFWRAAREPGRRGPRAGVAVTFAVASLLRPTDAAALAAPLLLAPFAPAALIQAGLPRRRYAPGAVAAVAGLAVGWGAWVAEAFARFGGPWARLRAGAEVNDAGVGFILWRHLQAVDGPGLLCRPADVCADVHWAEVAWWFVVPMLGVVALLVARAEGVRYACGLAIACAVAPALPYVFLFDYANTRFLQPTYALLMIPAAVALARTPWRGGVAVLVPMALVGHIAGQVASMNRVTVVLEPILAAQRAQAAALKRQGVHPGCVIVGRGAIQMGYLTGCRSIRTPDDPAVTDPRVAEATATGRQTVLLLRRPVPTPDGWRRLTLPPTSPGAAYVW